jgi:hypothetical protein
MLTKYSAMVLTKTPIPPPGIGGYSLQIKQIFIYPVLYIQIDLNIEHCCISKTEFTVKKLGDVKFIWIKSKCRDISFS